MKLPKSENSEHERPGSSPWLAILHVAAGLLLGWMPLLFARGTEIYFTDTPSVWIYTLGFVIAATSLGIAIGLGAVRHWQVSGQRWAQTLLLLGAFATMPLLPTSESFATSPVDPALEFLKLLFLKAGIVSLAIGVFIGTRLEVRTETDANPTLPTIVGILVGQLGFLIVLDPRLTNNWMDVAFSWCVLAFALAAIAAVWRTPATAVEETKKKGTKKSAGKAESPNWPQAGLAAVAVMYLLVVSAQTMRNLVSDPRLWILPVLITMVAFAAGRFRPALQQPLIIALLQLMGAVALTASLYYGARWSPGVFMEALYLGLATSVLSVGAAAGMRADSDQSKRQTALPWVAVIVGVALVTFVAQKLTNEIIEFPATIFLGAILVMSVLKRSARTRWAVRAGILGCVLLAAALTANLYLRGRNVVTSARSFFGITKAIGMGAGSGAYRLMLNGDSPRAVQFLAADARMDPNLYHGYKTGIGLLFKSFPKGNFRRIGIVGIGNGDLLSFADPDDSYQFYEFDPAAIKVANDAFTYLPGARRVNFDWKLVRGAPRIVLDRADPEQFDILILDVFDSGPLPAHLLTKEAFAIWQKHLANDGVIAINLTNNRFNLLPVVWRQAIELGMTMIPAFTSDDPNTGTSHAEWVFITRNAELLRNKAFLKPKEADITQARDFPLWTDENSRPLSVLK